jgi:hypothetical protein
MTDTTRPPIPGISATELAIMQNAAARLTGSDTAVTGSLQTLTQDAPAHAAGRVSALREMYMSIDGSPHWCLPAPSEGPAEQA